MSCGCKNKVTNSQPAQSQPVQNTNQQAKTQATNESVQNTIKKTIEKYYNQNKSR